MVSGGTDNHLFLVSLIRQGLTGKDADAALGRAGITVNKNAVPNDPQSPFVTSGLRIGTPAITTRGFKEAQSIEPWRAGSATSSITSAMPMSRPRSRGRLRPCAAISRFTATDRTAVTL